MRPDCHQRQPHQRPPLRGHKTKLQTSPKMLAATQRRKYWKPASQHRCGLGVSKLLTSAALCTLAAYLMAPHCQPAGLPAVEGLKALKSLAKTFVYQQLTMRKNFVPLPVPIPVPIEIDEPPVYLKGKPKYVNVYKTKATPAPVVKPTTGYHMPIYSPTYDYMSVDPMSSMYGHMSPAIYTAPYGRAQSAAKEAAEGGAEGGAEYASPSGGSPPLTSSLFNDYDDEVDQYYAMGRLAAARRRAKLLSATAPEYLQGASLDFLNRSDQADQRGAEQSQHMAASQTHPGRLDETQTSARGEKDADTASSALSIRLQSQLRPQGAALKRAKRQVYYESGYDGQNNCDGFPLEVNIRSRIKMDQLFPIHGKSQMKKCIKRKRPIHILPPPEDHY